MDRSEYEIDHVIAESMESLLADVIQKYPILYDKDAKHRIGGAFREKSDEAWNEISDELNLELDSCKSLWSCMKQKFIKHRKRIDNGEAIAPWPTFNKLYKWLNRHVKKRKSRQDYIKQVKTSNTKTILEKQNENQTIDDDDTNEPDEEWTELMDDKNTTVQIQLKRKSDAPHSSGQSESKKKFNIEVIRESGTTIYDDGDLFSEPDQKILKKDEEIVVLEKRPHTEQIEVIEVKEQIPNPSQRESTVNEHELEKILNKIDQVLAKYTHSIELCSAENSKSDSNDAFGKYIASMIRELPAEKRMSMRLKILQYTTELISNENHHA